MSSEWAQHPLTGGFHLLPCSICSYGLSQGDAEVAPSPAALSHPALSALLVPPDTAHFISILTFLGQAL